MNSVTTSRHIERRKGSVEARALFRLLENNFSPLGLTKQAAVILDSIEKPEYVQYVDAIKAVTTTKTLKQISVIYEVISWERLQKMIPFYDELALERFIVDVSKHRFVKAEVDHRGDSVRFGGAAEATLAGGVDLEDADGFTGDDTQLGVEGIRGHLEIMYNKLRGTVEQLDGEKLKNEALENVKKSAVTYAHCRQQDYERIMNRSKKIETYKETSEREKAEKSAKAAEEASRRDELKRQEERKRLELENQTIEKKKREADKREVEEKIKADQMRKLLSTSFGMNILREYGEAQIAEMDIEQVLKEQRERLDKERQQTQQRLQQQERKFDHWVRALHLEEMLERRAIMDKWRKEAPKLWQDYEEKRVKKAIDEHNRQVDLYEKLQAIGDTAEEWMEEVKEKHGDDFARKMEEWAAKLDAVKSARLAERAEERRKGRRMEWLQKKAEEERRRKEEEERQKQVALEEQRRARRGEMENRRRGDRDMEGAESKAMNDDDWRRGAVASRPTERRVPPSFGGERERERERPPMKERNENVADRVDDWRATARPVAAPPPERPAPGERPRLNLISSRTRANDTEAPSREDLGKVVRREDAPPREPLRRDGPSREGPLRDGPPREGPLRDGPPREEQSWERGAVIRKAPLPPPAEPTPTNDGGGAWERAGPKKNVAPREERSSQPTQSSWRSNLKGAPSSDNNGPSRDPPRRPAINRNTNSSADTDNWRRK